MWGRRCLLLTTLFLVVCVGCSKKKSIEEVLDSPVYVQPSEDVAAMEAREVAKKQPLSLTSAPASVYFDFDRYNLRQASTDALAEVAQIMFADQSLTLIIDAHACPIGTNEWNLALSDRRGHECKRYLVALEVEESRIQVVAWGEEHPKTTDPLKYEQNRRCDFTLSEGGK